MISMDERDLETERFQVISERNAAISKLFRKNRKEDRILQDEFIRPLNERLLQINRQLGV